MTWVFAVDVSNAVLGDIGQRGVATGFVCSAKRTAQVGGRTKMSVCYKIVLLMVVYAICRAWVLPYTQGVAVLAASDMGSLVAVKVTSVSIATLASGQSKRLAERRR